MLEALSGSLRVQKDEVGRLLLEDRISPSKKAFVELILLGFWMGFDLLLLSG